ncbi:hypothetical protein SAMN05660284_00028 [Formivibrio citricus]|uniref:Uncharacterized protein n=1 Tax=Formivibrio citricus TaxID=83765 RepID=A0A1I4UYB3_9NEIS|nr:hypothetical protein SAMN05660284_00028 [Formivibrio citricus]
MTLIGRIRCAIRPYHPRELRRMHKPRNVSSPQASNIACGDPDYAVLRLIQATQFRSATMADDFHPLEPAEHRRLAQGFRRGLFEAAGQVPQPPWQSRSAGNPEGGRWGRLGDERGIGETIPLSRKRGGNPHSKTPRRRRINPSSRIASAPTAPAITARLPPLSTTYGARA